jgi:hypothetical protein
MWHIRQLVVGSKILVNTNYENELAIWYQRKKTLPRNTTTFGGYLKIVHFQWKEGKGKSIWTKAIFTKAIIATMTSFGTPTTNKMS